MKVRVNGGGHDATGVGGGGGAATGTGGELQRDCGAGARAVTRRRAAQQLASESARGPRASPVVGGGDVRACQRMPPDAPHPTRTPQAPQILESSQTLLNVLKRETVNLSKRKA